MADKPISELTDLGPVEESDEVAVVRSGSGGKAQLGSMAAEDADDFTPTSGLAAIATSGALADLSGAGNMAAQNKDAVEVTGGSITGIPLTYPLMNYGGYHFDGSTNYLDGNALTGIADGKKGTAFAIVRFANASGSAERILSNSSNRFTLLRSTGGNLQLQCFNASGTTILNQALAGALASAGTYAIMASWDLATPGSMLLYCNDVTAALTSTTFTDDAIDYTGAEWAVGASTGGSQPVSGDIYSVWFDATQNLNFSDVNVRRKFIDANLNPLFLGHRGELPTGTAPGLFLGYSDYTTWPQNRGSLPGTFTENGTPAVVTTVKNGQFAPMVGPGSGIVSNKSGAALATNATKGHFYVPTCAGTPTGTPLAVTGATPIIVDSTNNKLYFYSGGAWRDAGP